MEDVSGKITLYHNLFIIFLILFFVFLIIAITLFFVLRIPETLGFLTGRAAKKGIQQLEEGGGSITGTLDRRRERTNMLYVDQKMKEDMGVTPGMVTPGARHIEKAVSDPAGPLNDTIAGNIPAENTSDTAAKEVNETSVLNAGMQEISVLSNNGNSTEKIMKKESPAGFVTEQEIIMIHTEEVI